MSNLGLEFDTFIEFLERTVIFQCSGFFCYRLNGGDATADTGLLAGRIKRGCMAILTVAAFAVPLPTKNVVLPLLEKLWTHSSESLSS